MATKKLSILALALIITLTSYTTQKLSESKNVRYEPRIRTYYIAAENVGEMSTYL